MAVMNIISFIQGGYATTEWNVIYFIGIRVNINGMFLASTSISLLNAYLGKRSDKVICIIQIVLNLIFIVSEWVSTSILSALLFAGVLLFSWMIHRWPARGKVFRRIGIVLLFLILIFMINPDVSRFSWLIEGFLGESLTLDGRTVLWQHALSQLGGVDWLFGRGYGNDALFEIGNGFVATTAHSQYINILFRHGFVGLAFYAIILIQQIRNATTCENTVVQAIMMASFIATIAMNIVNSTYLEGYIYIWWIVCLLYLRNDFIIGCES